MEPLIYSCPEVVNSTNADKVTNELITLIRNKRDIIIDLGNTRYISSAGLRSFFITQKALNACSNCSLTLRNPDNYVMQTLQLTGVEKIFKIE